jgi:polyphenol oxidase
MAPGCWPPVKPRPPWPDADGLCSDAGGQSLWVCGADCTPVLLADPVRGAVAACHAGWRGVARGILAEAVRGLVAAGSVASDLLVALGPAVAGENYQVERNVSSPGGGEPHPPAELSQRPWPPCGAEILGPWPPTRAGP